MPVYWYGEPVAGADDVYPTNNLYPLDDLYPGPQPDMEPEPYVPSSIPNAPAFAFPGSVSDTIWLQTLDERWEVVGADRERGVTIDGVQASADHNGPRDLSFALMRDSDVAWPDLSAYTPLEYWSDGLKVWSGRIRDTPADEQLAGDAITINAVGWQYHLDDDKLSRLYVHTRQSDWRDQRSFLTANLANFVVSGDMPNDRGMVSIGWPNGAILPSSAFVGITLDTGEGHTATRLMASYTHSNNAAAITCYGRATPVESVSAALASSDAWTFALSSGESNISNAAFATPYRYVHIFLFLNTGATLAAGDVWVKFTDLRVWTNEAYHSTNNSTLRASTVVSDVHDRALPHLLADKSRIVTSNFVIPDFGTHGHQSPREIIEAVNAFEDYRIGVDEARRLVFEPRPTVAEVETFGQFDEASFNSGDDIFNRVVVEGTGPDGEPLVATRSSADSATPSYYAADQPSNPSFATDTTGWTAVSGTITRDTGSFNTTPASGRLTANASGYVQVKTTLPNQVVGVLYTVTVWLNTTVNFQRAGSLITVLNSAETANLGTNYLGAAVVGSYVPIAVSYVARGSSSVLFVNLWGNPSQIVGYIDTVGVSANRTTIPDRRGFRRTAHLPVQSPLPRAALEVIGDLWLSNHIRTPLKGAARIERGDARTIVGGQPVAPAEMLLRWGERLRLARTRNPDTGSSHREGVVASVSYDSREDAAEVAIDSEQKRVEAFLERLHVVTGQRG